MIAIPVTCMSQPLAKLQFCGLKSPANTAVLILDSTFREKSAIVLFKRETLDRIAAGTVTIAFRRWKRPTVKEGGTLVTAAGLLSIDSVEEFDEENITLLDARLAGFASRELLLRRLAAARDGTLYRIRFSIAGPDPRIALRTQKRLSPGEIEQLSARLAQLDDRAADGPWTTKVLRLVQSHPARRAQELADRSGHEKNWLKHNVRKLKNLGLTESLKIGYRVSPRGKAYLAALASK